MNYTVQCTKCKCSIVVRGNYESDTNATVLNDNDSAWQDACQHIQDGDYEIAAEDIDED